MTNTNKTGKAEVKIRASVYAKMAEYEKLTGVSMEEQMTEALTEYLAAPPPRN